MASTRVERVKLFACLMILMFQRESSSFYIFGRGSKAISLCPLWFVLFFKKGCSHAT
jgi:hypothetical protein